MKKSLKLILAALLFLLSIPANSIVYLNENFDGLSSTEKIPSGWDNNNGTTAESYRWQQNTSGYGGSGNCLMFNSFINPKDRTNDLFTPEITLHAGSQATLKFQFKNATGGPFKVCVAFITQSDTTYEDLETNLKATDWTEREYPLVKYANKTFQIVFSSISNYGSGDAKHYIDDVVVKDPELCARPIDLNITGLSQTSASIDWSLGRAINSPSKYKLTVIRVPDGGSVISNDNVTPDGEYYTISPLEAGTEYIVKLQSDCQANFGGFSDESDPLRITTLLNPIELPYNLYFDDEESIMPLGVITNGNVTINTVQSYNPKGNSLLLKSTTTERSLIVFPQVNHFSNDLQFAAQVRSSAANTKYTIGLMSDPLDMSTFVPVYEGTVPTANVWCDMRFTTENIQGGGQLNQSIAIMLADGSSSSVYFDDIKLSKIPTCPRPEGLTIYETDSNSVSLSWIGTSPITSQAMLITSTGATADTTIVDIDNTPSVVRNLNFNTAYTVRVREICSDGDTAEWSLPTTFHTLCGINSELLFSENFDEKKIPECWFQSQIVKPTSTSGTDWGDKAWSTTSYSSKNVLELRNGRDGSHNLLILQPIRIDQAGAYDIEFEMFRSSYVTGGSITCWINNKPDTVNAQKCELINVMRTLAPIEKVDGWYEYAYNIQREGVVYIMFEGVVDKDFSSYINYIRVVNAPTCRKINDKNITVTDITQSSFKLNWETQENMHSTLLRYKLSSKLGEKLNTMVVPKTATDMQSCILQGLQPSTKYTLDCSLASYCGGTDTSVWVTYSTTFVSECGVAPFPFIEDFEDNEYDTPLCWLNIDDGNGPYWKINSTENFVSSGTKSLQLVTRKSAINPLFVSPELNLGAGEYRLKFTMQRSYHSTDSIEGLKVWMNNTPDTIGGKRVTYIPNSRKFAPIEAKDGMYQYSYDFTIAGAKYLIFEGIMKSNSSVYIDNVSLRVAPTCKEMGRFELASYSDTDIKVSLLDDANVEWQVQYGPQGFALGSGKTVSSTAKECTITGLESATLYDVYIRKMCSDTDMSEWSEAQTIKTCYSPFVISETESFFEGFEGYKEYAEIEDYFVTASESAATAIPSKAIKTKFGVSAYQGTLWSCQDADYNQIRYVPVRLKANTNYSASGYFIQDNDELTSTEISIVLSSAPTMSPDKVIVIDYVVKEWKLVEGFFTVPADGVYYVGFRIKESPTSHPIQIGLKLSVLDRFVV